MKKKSNLKKIALMGMTGGVLMAQAQADAQQNGNFYQGIPSYYIADGTDSSTNNGSQTKSESDLFSQLSSEGKSIYQGLNKEGKLLALKLASQTCKGHNDCKGQNSCKTTENACAGQGGCKGTSKGPFIDKNDAVKVAAMNMAEKRTNMMLKGAGGMSENELLLQLSLEGKSVYQGLSKEGKASALKLASQTCKGHNDCKGQNSCKTKENACAGQGGCKGTSKGPFIDKNDAVKVAAMNMAAKRSKLNSNGIGG